MDKTVILGLSGGVDSLVSAILLQEQGYKVIACSFKLWGNEASINNAQKLAETIGIEFRIIDVSKPFKNQIIDPFIRDYIDGETPNPCIWCNNEIKVYYLFQEMINQKADFFASGHYIQIKKEKDLHYIHRGVDLAKDQSYFLWNVRSKYLKYWLTPLGAYTKKEVKQIAIDNRMGFLAHKKESMGICFIEDSGYHSFIEKNKTKEQTIELGNIVDNKGVVLGQHKGTAYYTIGQKKGLEIEQKGLSVTQIDAANKLLVVGDSKELYTNQFIIRDYYFIDKKDMLNPKLYVWVRGLGRNPNGFCKINIIDDINIKVNLDGKAWALAKGQPVTFYIDNQLVGGGYIK